MANQVTRRAPVCSAHTGLRQAVSQAVSLVSQAVLSSAANELWQFSQHSAAKDLKKEFLNKIRARALPTCHTNNRFHGRVMIKTSLKFRFEFAYVNWTRRVRWIHTGVRAKRSGQLPDRSESDCDPHQLFHSGPRDSCQRERVRPNWIRSLCFENFAKVNKPRQISGSIRNSILTRGPHFLA